MNKRWVDEIVEVFERLGRVATYDQIYREIESSTNRKLTPEWKATVRRTIEMHSSESMNYQGSEDYFYPYYGIDMRSGKWGLKKYKG